MSAKRRTSKVLRLLIPTGVIGISAALAATQAHADITTNLANSKMSVADRLSQIRSAVSSVNHAVIDGASGANVMLAEWLNVGRGFGWRNGGWGNGWHNGGWHNGGWGNGGWGNGGWHNGGWRAWGNGGWHNWHNFWHNW
jgi:rSAM-associated Gly-rich repeat protein